ncbi:MAG: YraN family protein [Gammaproteobacteria bacterium]|nr:YraN family protein [Gammaproteobacteria bacterium]MDH5728096.1 YraN family protein [Gammaproteobacteria bacterium]
MINGTRKTIGNQAEAATSRFLQSQGLLILEEQYHGPHGEVDLIARDGEYTVFVEVRYRKSVTFGTPSETISVQKQRRLIATAQRYLQHNRDAAKRPSRFDVVAVTPAEHSGLNFNWIQNAFETI